MAFFKKDNAKKSENSAAKKTAFSAVTKKEISADKKSPENILGVIRSPHLTEKSSNAASQNKFVFLISEYANKKEVKHDVEARYKVGVDNVHIINLPGKERRRGNQIGWKKGRRKAIVTIQAGQTIEIQ